MGLRESLPPLWLAAVVALAGVTAGILVPKGERRAGLRPAPTMTPGAKRRAPPRHPP